MVYTLYNSMAGAHFVPEQLEEKLRTFFKDESFVLTDTTEISDKMAYIEKLGEGDKLVIVGGDGTLNKFVNSIEDKEYPFPIYCYAGGTGNDFINDVVGVENADGLVQINDYITNLPVVTVNGKDYKFINGIGYGIDGYCCEEGDRYREKKCKSPNYTKIAIKGLLGAFKPRNAKITIDGVTHEYKHVWMAPTMNGRFFGGGMMITPAQDRLNAERELSIVAVPCKSRIRILTIFPKIFKGDHVKYDKVFKVFRGKDVHIEFEKPCALQIDGETILNVKEYSAKSSALIKKKEEATV